MLRIAAGNGFCHATHLAYRTKTVNEAASDGTESVMRCDKTVGLLGTTASEHERERASVLLLMLRFEAADKPR